MQCTHVIIRELAGGTCPICTPGNIPVTAVVPPLNSNSEGGINAVIARLAGAAHQSGNHTRHHEPDRVSATLPDPAHALSTQHSESIAVNAIRLYDALTPGTPIHGEVIAQLMRNVPPDERGRVYFLLTEDRTLIKVGKTKSPGNTRASKLTGQSPVPLTLIAEIDGYTAVEKWFHDRFAPFRTHGEWFRYEGIVKETVEALLTGAHPCVHLRDLDSSTGFVAPVIELPRRDPDHSIRPQPTHTHPIGIAAQDAADKLRHDEVIAERCRRSLSYFVRQAWNVLMPGIPFLWNWHLEQICKHVQCMLEEWIRKQVDPSFVMRAQNLAINCPPRSLKSTIVSVCAPAWMWLRWPSWKSIFVSANPTVAIRDARGCKTLLTSEWYEGIKECLANQHEEGSEERKRYEWTIDPKHDADGDFGNTAGGTRLAMGFLAVVVGLGGDAIFIDDPNDTKKVMSEAERARINDTWDLSLCNRVNSFTDSIRIMIMQRCHELDLTGHWHGTMPDDLTIYLAIPLEFDLELAESSSKSSPFGYSDPRVKEGDILHEARFPERVVASERVRLGPYGFAGQMNQKPVPADGGDFKREWWNFCYITSPEPGHHALRGSILDRNWQMPQRFEDQEQARLYRSKRRPKGCDLDRPAMPVPFLDTLVITVDATFGSLKDEASRVGMLAVGIKMADRFVLEDRTKARTFLETIAAIKELIRDFPATSVVLIEKKANGAAVIETVQHEISGVIAIENNENWMVRANAMIPAVAAGNWYLLEGAPWLTPFVAEFGLYPNGAHDDRIDSASQLAKYYATGGYQLPDW